MMILIILYARAFEGVRGVWRRTENYSSAPSRRSPPSCLAGRRRSLIRSRTTSTPTSSNASTASTDTRTRRRKPSTFRTTTLPRSVERWHIVWQAFCFLGWRQDRLFQNNLESSVWKMLVWLSYSGRLLHRLVACLTGVGGSTGAGDADVGPVPGPLWLLQAEDDARVWQLQDEHRFRRGVPNLVCNYSNLNDIINVAKEINSKLVSLSPATRHTPSSTVLLIIWIRFRLCFSLRICCVEFHTTSQPRTMLVFIWLHYWQ